VLKIADILFIAIETEGFAETNLICYTL